MAALVDALTYRDLGKIEEIKCVVLDWLQTTEESAGWTVLIDAMIEAAYELQG